MEISVRDNLKEVERRIAEAARRAGRDPSDVELIVVTKNRSIDQVRQVLSCGPYVLGENRVQEALGKIPALPPDTRWHLIGHLQRNKAKQAVGSFGMIHSLDSLRLAEALQVAAEKRDIAAVETLVEVNVSGEESKFGLPLEEVESLLAEISRSIDRLRICGLMTMAPFFDDPENTRPVFRRLRELRDGLVTAGFDLPQLSMGMTNDFEVAIEEGATMVRVGTAVFGPRDS